MLYSVPNSSKLEFLYLFGSKTLNGGDEYSKSSASFNSL